MMNKENARRTLNELGLSIRYIGYSYILHAIDLIDEDESVLIQANKVLYVEIAKLCNTTPTCVEKNIRHSINTIWKNADDYADLIPKIFSRNHLHKKPSNKVFLELLYNHVKILETADKRCPLYGCECPILCHSSTSS